MPGEPTPPARPATILAAGEGRHYAMGRLSAVFKADGAETAGRYSVSEWWLEPNTTGPGPHSHPEDEVFYVLEGTMHVLIGEQWHGADAGSCLVIPGGTIHDFQNRSRGRAGLLNVFTPGAFEPRMPSIVEWFRTNPPGDATP